jgi:hypothetical protein
MFRFQVVSQIKISQRVFPTWLARAKRKWTFRRNALILYQNDPAEMLKLRTSAGAPAKSWYQVYAGAPAEVRKIGSSQRGEN